MENNQDSKKEEEIIEAQIKLLETKKDAKNNTSKGKKWVWVFISWVICVILFWAAIGYSKIIIFKGNLIYFLFSLGFVFYGLKIVILRETKIRSRFTAHSNFSSTFISPWIGWNKIKISGEAAIFYGILFLILGIGLFVVLLSVSLRP